MTRTNALSRLLRQFTSRSTKVRKNRLKRSLSLQGMERLEDRRLLAMLSMPNLNAPYFENEVIVKVDPSQIDSLRSELQAIPVYQSKSQPGLEVWNISASNKTVDDAIGLYWRDDRFIYIEPNYDRSLAVMPDDDRFESGDLWGLHNTGQLDSSGQAGLDDADIDAPEAWDITVGSSSVVVGVLDTGADYNHPDLAPNMWLNVGEIPGDNLDNDGNGYIDDVHGYDFFNNDGDPMDGHSHGTHTAGTIGAEGNNNVGVVGVNWDVSIMALKIFSDGGGYAGDVAVADSIDYSIANGARLTSNSWGGGGFSQTLFDAISRAEQANQLFIAAAGNWSQNNDQSPFFPANYELDNVISVAASDNLDNRASFSSWGATTVDLTAPGVSTLSTVPSNGYDFFNGTSMATPHVSGVAALIESVSPGAAYQFTKDVILGTVDVLSQWNGFTVTGGRLNAFRALDSLDRPTINGFSPDVSYVENAAPVTIDDNATIDLPGVTNMNGYQMEFGFTLFSSSRDTVALQSNARVTLGTTVVRVDGINIGSRAGGVGTTPLTITFNSNATPEIASLVLQAATFANSTETPTGLPRTMKVDVLDNTGTSLVSATKTITIQPVDDVSEIDDFGSSISYMENAAPVQVTSTVTVDDIDSNDLGGGKLVVWLSGAKPQDKLAVVNMGSITVGLAGEVLHNGTLIGLATGGTGTTPLEIEWNQSASLSRVRSAMRAIAFSNTGDNPTAQTRTVRAKLVGVDGGSSNLVSKTINVTPVNDIPVVAGFENSIAYFENSLPVVIAPALVVEDVDSSLLGTMTVSIIANSDSMDTLAVRAGGRIGIASPNILYDGVVVGSMAGGQGGADLVLTFNSSATRAKVQAIGRALTYSNQSDTPSESPKTLQIVVTDSDSAASSPRQLTVTISPANDPPKVTDFGGAINFVENGAPIKISETAQVTDADSANFNEGTLKVAVVQNVQAADQVLILDGGGVLVDETNVITVGGIVIGGFYGGANFQPMVVELNANASPARVQMLLRQVAFVHHSDNPSSLVRKVQVAVADGDGGFGQVVAKSVNVQPVNDLTAIENFGGALVYTENAAAIFVSTTARVIDPDAPNFDGGSLVVRLTANANPADIIAIRPSSLVTTVGTTVKYNNVGVGTLSGGVGNVPFMVRWNSQATATIVQNVLRRITFETTGDNPSTNVRTLTARIADGDGGTGIVVTKDISVIRRNDAPTITVPNAGPINYSQSGPAVSLLSGANLVDPDTTVFAGGRLSLKIISGTHESNRLGFSGRISKVGNSIMLDGTTEIGVINTNGGVGTTRMFIDLNSNATRANVIVLLRSLQFHTHGTSTLDTRMIEVSLTDGAGGLSNLLTREVNVQA
jgi:subtilisin family serine protease